MFKRRILRILGSAAALLVAEQVLPGMELADYKIALLAAVIFAIINVTIKPIVKLFAFPITFFTLGLFSFVINAGFFLLVSRLIEGFEVDGFLTALLGSILVSFINSVLHSIIDKK
ncbi:hypothetical protein BHU72_00590 [Desulfuribacillus stibiiarsenatis]|uniref:Phage holin family protein n=1 Tax=Desulfuribacillus stibiiarsenatis TaxID=1390249 RepID=A0A1E5L9J7_9FIRM|nr:phage holin family protein [Desulfuribacillus stibiiarsenatis]OEH86801.1 hypothetical protein BHU72_00590 [Desulfuribacillus stibiiarsenatis]